ncbi:hypothetical protein MASR2M70_22180 [Bacillota bacterium]
MKRIIMTIIITAIIAAAPAVYGDGGVKVYVNGKEVVSDVPAAIVSGRTMLPFRAVFNALGVGDDSIKWNRDSKSIEVSKEGKYIFLAVGSSGAIFNDNLITLDAAPYIENGRTLVPVRFVSEALEAKVEWNDKTQVVKITK